MLRWQNHASGHVVIILLRRLRRQRTASSQFWTTQLTHEAKVPAAGSIAGIHNLNSALHSGSVGAESPLRSAPMHQIDSIFNSDLQMMQSNSSMETSQKEVENKIKTKPVTQTQTLKSNPLEQHITTT